MRYTVGAYVIERDKPFSSIGEAVQFIQKRYPELVQETIEEYIKPVIPNNGNDKSGNIPEKDTVSDKSNAKNSTARDKELKAGKD